MGLAMSILISLLLLQATPAEPATAKPATPPSDGAKIVCKTITPTGSRLGGTRKCAPKREWDRLAAETEEATRALTKSTRTCSGGPC